MEKVFIKSESDEVTSVETVYIKGEPDELFLDDHNYAFGVYKHLEESNPLSKTCYVYKCKECAASFTKKRVLDHHMKNHNRSKLKAEEWKPYLCPTCPAKFGQEKNYLYHVKKMCGKTFQCTHCPKIFMSVSTLNMHIRWGCSKKRQESRMAGDNCVYFCVK